MAWKKMLEASGGMGCGIRGGNQGNQSGSVYSPRFRGYLPYSRTNFTM